ncbi:hypothetical protein BC832DRAFT_538588 [Gaertneriomyces semiglobifer]|nr:hypothetical protein BC832DRAFT_538588 [Gaertneriomyces semiglobifer]
MNRRPHAPVVVRAFDLHRLKNKVGGLNVEDKVTLAQKHDRNQRHHASLSRISKWDNTITGQRRKRLQARAARQAQEEAERVRMDLEYAREEEVRRQEAIERAQRLQYYQTDAVKGFHSKIMLFEALRERDMQLQMKEAQLARQQERDLAAAKEAKSRAEAADEEEFKKLTMIRERAMDTYQEQLLQEKDKKAREAAEREERLAERKAASLLDEEYHMIQHASRVKQSEARKELRHQLMEGKDAAVARASMEKQQDAEAERRAREWVDQKSKQLAKRKEVEEAWFTYGWESLKQRQAIGQQIFDEGARMDARIQERAEKAILERTEKEERQLEEAAGQRRKMAQDMRDSYNRHMEAAAAKKSLDKEQDKALLQECLRVQAQVQEEDRQRQHEKRRKARELQQAHRLQTLELAEARDKETRGTCEYEEKQRRELELQDETFLTYMKSVSNESWARENSRLQTYIRQQVSSPKGRSWRLADQFLVDTGRRLGLVPAQTLNQSAANKPCRAGPSRPQSCSTREL